MWVCYIQQKWSVCDPAQLRAKGDFGWVILPLQRVVIPLREGTWVGQIAGKLLEGTH